MDLKSEENSVFVYSFDLLIRIESLMNFESSLTCNIGTSIKPKVFKIGCFNLVGEITSST